MKFSSYAGSLFIAAFLLAGSLASAQNFGSLQGQVSDPSGSTVPQVAMEMQRRRVHYSDNTELTSIDFFFSNSAILAHW